MRTVTVPVVHYFHPDLSDQNICKRRRGRNWAATTDPDSVTCKRCRELIAAQKMQETA
jgi:hypothetical protein